LIGTFAACARNSFKCDELWTFVHTKQGHLQWNDPREWGDAYIWLALDSDTKLILSYHVGRRTQPHAQIFNADLRARTEGTNFQITTDGLDAYVPAVLDNFGSRIAFAQLIKQYSTSEQDSPDWYKSAKFVRTVPNPVSGNVDESRISTSHIEPNEFECADVSAALYTARARLQQEQAASRSSGRLVCGVVQLLSDS
jgi:IS1 family transposase